VYNHKEGATVVGKESVVRLTQMMMMMILGEGVRRGKNKFKDCSTVITVRTFFFAFTIYRHPLQRTKLIAGLLWMGIA
jgi:hypothetical protein